MKQYQNVLLCVSLHQLITLSIGQQVAPGVPPQQYNNQQYQQQPPVQYHDPNQVQYQQVPQQPIQQQYQQQQPPPQQYQPAQPAQPPQQTQYQAHSAHDHGDQKILSGDVASERDHIQQHMQIPIDTSKMSEQELQFHYFKMHDADNNNKLDGSELIKSLIHWHEQGSKDHNHNPQQPKIEEKVFNDDELIALIDPILKMDDTSRDGFIDYPEFIRAQEKAAANQQQQQKQPH